MNYIPLEEQQIEHLITFVSNLDKEDQSFLENALCQSKKQSADVVDLLLKKVGLMLKSEKGFIL